MSDRVWVTLPDNYGEGLSPPTAAFLSKEEADAYASHMSAGGYRSYVVHEAPMMRFVPARIEPVISKGTADE